MGEEEEQQGQPEEVQPEEAQDDLLAPLEESAGEAAVAEPVSKKSALDIAAAAMKARKEREERAALQEQAKKLSLLARVQKLDVGERCKLGREGDKDCRTLLVRDGNKMVALSVLTNPKLTLNEVEFFAASRNVDEEVLREIARNRDWSKEYAVILALVNNPKTPVGVALTLVPKLHIRDLRFLAKNRGVPEAVRVVAKRMADRHRY
jgi:hypothetical protein